MTRDDDAECFDPGFQTILPSHLGCPSDWMSASAAAGGVRGEQSSLSRSGVGGGAAYPGAAVPACSSGSEFAEAPPPTPPRRFAEGGENLESVCKLPMNSIPLKHRHYLVRDPCQRPGEPMRRHAHLM